MIMMIFSLLYHHTLHIDTHAKKNWRVNLVLKLDNNNDITAGAITCNNFETIKTSCPLFNYVCTGCS